jgi:hypothetical protein
MESMNLLDITIKYFGVIVFLMCVVFGMISLFASWIAWREIHRKRSIIRSIIAAYNITEDSLEKGRTANGDLDLDPALVQTIFNSLQEILNAVYGEITGRPMPPREERFHGSRTIRGVGHLSRMLKRREGCESIDVNKEVPKLIPTEQERHHCVSGP